MPTSELYAKDATIAHLKLENADLRRQLAEVQYMKDGSDETKEVPLTLLQWAARAERAEADLAAAREQVRMLAEALKLNIRWEHRQRFPHVKATAGEAIGDAALAAYEAQMHCTCYKPFGGAHQADCPHYSIES